MKDTECPYCHKDQEINTDDGYGLDDGGTFNQECGDCGKTFIFTTTITVSHEAYEAPCLNGAPHNMQPIKGVPAAFFVGKTRCTCCGLEETDKIAHEAAIAEYLAATRPAPAGGQSPGSEAP